ELNRSEVRQVCVALHTKLQWDKEGRQQWGKRLNADQFHLSDYQKVVFANSYKAARNESRPIDYLRMSKSCHFTAFAGKPDVLQSMESAVIAEMRLALEEQRKIDGGMEVTSSADWKKELLKAKEQRKTLSEMNAKIAALELQLKCSQSLAVEFRAQKMRGDEENAQLCQDAQVETTSRGYNDSRGTKLNTVCTLFKLMKSEYVHLDRSWR
ncbi:hypothetical protein PHMEG_00041277, partial [Phytophthora megakarya]